MEVMVSSPPLDYEFGGNRPSPPHFAEYYSSAPSSPTRVSAFYREFDYFSTLHARDSSSSSSIQKSAKENNYDDDGDGFAFLVSQESDAASLTAEELFDGGKIKPLKLDQFPPIPLVSQREKGINIGDVLSPQKNKEKEERRGRDRTPAVLCPSSSGRRGARSHSPYRVSQYAWDEERHHLQQQSAKEESASSTTSKSSSSRKWRLRDFLLFRSASEGRGSSKDPLRKYSALDKKPEDVKMRSTDSPAASRRRGPISPHEFHYAIKKAESQDLKKKTYLPYKQGILGRLAGLGSLTR